MRFGATISGAILFSLMIVWEMTAAESQANFYKDVLPILQKNCQNCHRPGQIAPTSFLTYSSVRPWAKAMKAAVVTRKMPPWFADPQYGHFSNDRSLPQSEIDTIVKWVDSGAPEGNPADAPAAIHWPENNWQIQPDVIVDVPPFKVPANGLVEWTNITIPNPFKKDTWVTAILFRPDNVAVTHHIGVLSTPHSADTGAIPRTNANWESPVAEAVFEGDAKLVWFRPHMHVRGKDMTYRLEYPDGRKEIILNVPRYDFNWQLGYELATPIKVPKGTRFVATAHFDNSANNKFNPDPNRMVYYGNQTWEEMMQPFFGIVVNKKVDPQKLLKRLGPIPSGAE